MLPFFLQQEYALSKWGLANELEDEPEDLLNRKRIVVLRPTKVFLPEYRKPFELKITDFKSLPKGLAYTFTRDVMKDGHLNLDILYSLAERMNDRSFVENLLKQIYGTENKFKPGTPLVTPKFALEKVIFFLDKEKITDFNEQFFWSAFVFYAFSCFDGSFSSEHLVYLLDGTDSVQQISASSILITIVRDKLERVFDSIFSSGASRPIKGVGWIGVSQMAENCVSMMRDAISEIREIVKFSQAYMSFLARLRVYLYHRNELSVEDLNRFQLNPDFLALSEIFDLQVACVSKSLNDQFFSADQWPLFDSIVAKAIFNIRGLRLYDLKDVVNMFGCSVYRASASDRRRVVSFSRLLDNSRVFTEAVYRHTSMITGATETKAVYYRPSSEAALLTDLSKFVAEVAAKIDMDDVVGQYLSSVISEKTTPVLYYSADLVGEHLQAAAVGLSSYIEMVIDDSNDTYGVRYVGRVADDVDRSSMPRYIMDDTVKTFSVHRLIFCCAQPRKAEKYKLDEMEFKIDFSGNTDYVELKSPVVNIKATKEFSIDIELKHLGIERITKKISWTALTGLPFSPDLCITNVPIFAANLLAPVRINSVFNEFCTYSSLDSREGGWFAVGLAIVARFYNMIMESPQIEALSDALFNHVWNTNPKVGNQSFRELYQSRPGALADKYTRMEFKRAIYRFLYRFLEGDNDIGREVETLISTMRTFGSLTSEISRRL